MTNNKEAEKEQIHARLLNWGRWLRNDNTYQKLGYPSKSPFVVAPTKGNLISDLDAQHIEEVVSSLNVSGINNAVIYAFILKIEYAERPTSRMHTVGDRAKDVSRHFNCRCGERTYYYHLAKARTAVSMLSGAVQ